MAKVNWTFQSLEDISDIAEYQAKYSEKYANLLVDLFLEKGNLLAQFPHLGRVVPESNIKSIREIIIKNYRIIYSIPNVETVDILAVRHSSIPLPDIDI